MLYRLSMSQQRSILAEEVVIDAAYGPCPTPSRETRAGTELPRRVELKV
jgi:hypothetical protein